MGLARVPLDEQQEAHLALILDLHKAEIAQVNQLRVEADNRQAHRLGPLTKSLGIPTGVNVNVEVRAGDQPCFLTYDAPDVERTLTLEPPRTDSGSRTEKSTALAGEGR